MDIVLELSSREGGGLDWAVVEGGLVSQAYKGKAVEQA